jgi:hypothetical protein
MHIESNPATFSHNRRLPQLRLYRRANRDGNPRQLTSEAPGTPYGLGASLHDYGEALVSRGG